MNMVISSSGPPSALAPADWLLQVGRLAGSADELLGGLCELLVSRGVPLERVGLHSRLLHPQLAGVRLLWRRGIGAEETLYRYDVTESGAYEKSPLYQVYTTAEIVRRRLSEPPAAVRSRAKSAGERRRVAAIQPAGTLDPRTVMG